MKFKKKLTWV